MAAPSSNAEFVELIRRSTVVEDDRLNVYLEQLEEIGNAPTEPTKLAGQMVRDGVLTVFQAEQFLQGKWKRFNIGKYRVLEKIGAGGMGQVFLCEHKLMRRRVAVKVLPTAKAEDPAARDRFYREARAVAALDHPNLVRAFDIDQDDNLHFLVMEYVDGVSLYDVVKKFGPMDPLRASHYMHQSAIGLEYAFQVAGIVHRDIKPGNILVDRSGVVKILDMGLARFFNDDADILTRKYDETVLGTADYLSPEQAIDSHTVDIRADLYSLGATFYFVLTGQPPFPDGTVAQKLIWHQSKQPKPLREVRPEVPAELAAVIEKMMRKPPGERYQNPTDLAEALAPLTATPIPPPPEQEMPQLSLAALAGGNAAPAARPSPRPSSKSSGIIARPKLPGPNLRSAGPAVLDFDSAPKSQRNGATSVAADSGSRPPSSGNPFSSLLTKDPSNSNTRSVFESVYSQTATPRPSQTKANHKRRPPPYQLLICAAVGLAALAGGIWWYATQTPSRNTAKNLTPSPSTGARTWVVGGGENDGVLGVATVAEALWKSRPGDRIVIKKETVSEIIRLDDQTQGSGEVTIESGLVNGRAVVWAPPADTAADTPLVEVFNCRGITLRDIQFDCRSRLLTAVRVSGNCAGLTLDRCHIVGYTAHGVRLADVSGDKTRPVTLQRCRFEGGGNRAEAAVRIESASPQKPVRHVRVTNCIFDGAMKAAIAGSGSAGQVDIARNRFYRMTDGVHWKQFEKGESLEATITGNTFAEIQSAALHFESSPAANDRSAVIIRQSLVVKSGAVLRIDGEVKTAFVNATHNVRDAQSQDGALPRPATQADKAITFQGADASDAKRFLRYPPGSELTTAAGGGPVGVPPTE